MLRPKYVYLASFLVLTACGEGIFSQEPLQAPATKKRQPLSQNEYPSLNDPVFQEPTQTQTPIVNTPIAGTTTPVTPVVPNPVVPTPVSSEPTVYINRVCKPLDVPNRSITGLIMKVYSLNYNWSKTFTDASLYSSVIGSQQLPKGIFASVPDGNYTVMFCSTNGHCNNPLYPIQSIASQFNMYTQSLSPMSNGPIKLLMAFGNMPDGSDGRIGGIPLLKIQGGKPIVPASAGAPGEGIKTSVRQLGSIIGGSGGLIAKDCVHSPLMIEMSDKKIELSSQENGIKFDIKGEGEQSRISWPENKSTGLLVLDRNKNGSIDNVHELFGNNTIGPDGKSSENGFHALDKYNDHGDDVIDARDSVFSELRFWFDYNRNGVADSGELISLPDLGVAKIHLNYVDMFDIDAYGNITAQRSIVSMLNGLNYRIFDVWFRTL